MAGTLLDTLRDVDPGVDAVADAVRPLLDAIGATGATQEDFSEGGQQWRRWTGVTNADDVTRLSLDPTSMRFTSSSGPVASPLADATGGLLSFPQPRVDWRLEAAFTGDPANPDYDGRFRLHLVLPSAVLKLPFLRGAKPDARGLLVADPAHPQVAITLPRLGLAVLRENVGAGIDTSLESATVDGAPAEDVFAFCRMDPPHALVGTSGAFGFTFSTAVLDLSAKNAPQAARGIPGEWQGLWLPTARIYVAPEGMEGIACSGGVRDLFVGFGASAGVTGDFDVEVLRKGAGPTVRMRLHGPDGAWFDVPDGGDGSTVTATAPGSATLVVEADGGLAPRTATITVGGGAPSTAWTAELAVPEAGDLSVVVTVTSSDGAGGTGPATTRTVRVSRAAALPGGGVGGGAGTPDAAVATTSTGQTRVVIASRGGLDVTLALDPPDAANLARWTVDGADRGTSESVTLTVAEASTHDVTAVRTRSSSTQLAAYWPFDHPEPGEDRLQESPPTTPYSDATARDAQATDRAGSAWTPGARPLRETLAARLATLAPGTPLTVTGFASFDGDDSPEKQRYNQRLSERRAGALKAMIDAARPGLSVTASGVGHTVHRQPAHRAEPAASYWRAVVTEPVPDADAETVTATVTRGSAAAPVPLPPPPTSPPPEPGHASWFRRLRVELVLHRSRFVKCEITGEVDLVTATEAAGNRLDRRPGGDPANPTDGVVTFTAKVTVDDATGDWSVALAVRAVESDRDGLWQVDRSGAANPAAVDIAGVFAGFGPLLSLTTPPSPAAGDLVPLALGAGLLTAASAVVHSRRVTLRGAELSVAAVGERRQVALLLDLEAHLFADLGVVEVPEAKAITTRYKALGLGVGVTGGDLEAPAVLFDASRGYTLDVPAGAVVARGPLGDILRVLGVNVSRDNPTFLEAEVGLGADLGVVSVERARVRVRLDGPLSPTLTGLTAKVDIPGTFIGTGSLDVSSDRLSGGIDVTLVPLGVRAAAKVTVVSKPGTLGVLVGAEVNLPAPLPLGSSGLAILGFIGGLGVNMARREPVGTRTPALDWLAAQPQRDPLDGFGWDAKPGSFAIAAGAIVGTTEGGFLFHLKGLVVLELPGPRLLLMAKADVLSLPPGLRSTEDAKFLAVVDISPAGISAGLVAEYSVIELVKVRVPVEAAFDFTNPSNWHVDLGRFDNPVSVEVFSVFRGSGYLMLSGNGITIPGLPELPNTGFAIAVGFSLTFLWGSEDIGLYLKVGAGFDAVLSFEPVGLVGSISIEGELRLFIVSIGANARLDVLSALRDGDLVPSTWIHGEVCGEVDFWLFSVKGCVDFTIGDKFKPAVPAAPLVRDVVLVSRAPAHVEGSATAGPVDGVLAAAAEVGTSDAAPQPVPIDVIPVVLFDTAVQPGGGFSATHDGAEPFTVTNVPVVANHPWIRRGDRWWRYEVLSVDLAGALDSGPRPATWWTLPGSPQPPAGSALALLSWVPEPLPRAIIAGEQRDAQAAGSYGSTCDPAAPPTRFLWHWNATPTGQDDEAPSGWSLDGIPWPDPPGTVRHTPAVARVAVTEPWRSGDPADLMRGIDPARVLGASVQCHDAAAEPDPWPAGSGAASLDGPAALDTLAALVDAGVDLRSVASVLTENRHDLGRLPCRGRVLRSPADDGREPSRLGDELTAKLVEAAWQRTGFVPPELVDAVRVTDRTTAAEKDPAAGIDALELLLLVPRTALDGRVVVRSLAAHGSELAREDLSSAQVVSTWGDLPPAWRDPAGPWREQVWLATGAALAVLGKQREGFLLLLVRPELPAGTRSVEVGWDPNRLSDDERAPGGAPAWYLVLAEGTVVAERVRFDWDTQVTGGRRHAISNALTKEEDDHALLVPGGSYTVAVRWRAFYAEQADDPRAASGTDAGEHTQTFRFTASSTPPASLEPWVVATTPGPDERAVLLDETVRVVQATDGVVRLFDAYGEKLEAVVRAASGRHPRPGGTRAEAGPLIAHLLGTSVVQATGQQVEDGQVVRIVSPWEEAVRAGAFDGECPPPGVRPGHPAEVIAYPFEPCTEHLLDVEAVRADGARRLVLRRGFTTSRYRSPAELADVLAGTRLQHRAVDRVPLDGLPTAPTGQALEAGFVAAGLPRPVVPDRPGTTLLWSREAVPQPVGLLLEAQETLVHRRPVPKQQPLPDPRDPTRKVWRAEPTDVLAPQVTAAGAAVTRTVVSPGGERVLVLLAPGGRGGSLDVALASAADPLVGTPAVTTPVQTVPLDRAPWEDDGPDGPWGG